MDTQLSIFVPIDIITVIFEMSDFIVKIRILATCNFFSQLLSIYDLSKIGYCYINKLDENILRQEKYARVTKLYVANSFISNISYLSNLVYLNAQNSSCRISQTSIQCLNLSELIIDDNIHIINLNHMSHLRILSANHKKSFRPPPVLKSESIEKLYALTALYINYNTNITNISTLTNLTILHIASNSSIIQTSLQNLNLIELDCSFNQHITDLTHMSNLKKLIAKGYGCGLKNTSIQKLDLVELHISGNNNLYELTHLHNLKILDASDNINISIVPISVTKLILRNNTNIINIMQLTKLTVLNIVNNKNIKTIPSSVINLNAGGYICAADQQTIQNINPYKLKITTNSRITNLNHMTNLRKLVAYGPECQLTNYSIKNINLRELYIDNNPFITNIRHMTNLITLSAGGRTCGITDESFKGINPQIIKSIYNPNISIRI